MSATRRLVYTLGAIWLVLAVIGSFVIAILPFPPGAASNVAGSVTDTIRLLTWAAWPVFSLTIIGVIGAVLVRRSDPDAAAAPARELRGNPRLASTWIGVVGAVVLALAIVGTITLGNDDAAQALGLGGRTISGDNGNVIGGALDEGGYLPVQVIAQQWQFTYRYPTLGGFESAHLVLPNNTNVQFHITSLDVTHSFWLIALGVKGDAVPLHDNVFLATTQQLGTYRSVCGELCGLWHGAMDDNSMQVVSAGDFDTWVAQEKALDAPIMKYLPPYSTTYVPDPAAYGS
jgi:cytochrome c oxidase subunit II